MFSATRDSMLYPVYHPSVLAAAALGRIDHHRAALQRHPGESAHGHIRLLAREHEGPQIEMTRLDVLADQSRRGRQAQQRLSDEVARVLADQPREFIALILARLRTDQHAVAA